MAISIQSLIPPNALYKTTPAREPVTTPQVGEDFGSIFESAKKLLVETNNMEQRAQNEATKFLIGETDNAHDVMIAAQEAQISLQYTNAIRSNIIQAYQQIMQMQI